MKDSILRHRRLILRSNWTLARLQESYQSVELLRLQRAAERRHIAAAVDDADDHIIWRQLISDVGKIGPATTATTRMRIHGCWMPQNSEHVPM
jgi:hypothetical protein